MAVLKVYNGTEWVSIASNLGSASYQTDQIGGTSDTYGILQGNANGVSTTFTTSLNKYVTGTLQVYLNGQLQTQGSAEDWAETTPSSGTFTFSTAPPNNSEITATYQSVLSTMGNADMVDGIHASSTPTANQLLALDASTNLNLNQNELQEVSVINTTSQDTDLLIKVNNSGATTTAVQIHGDSGIITLPEQSKVIAHRNTSQTINNITTTVIAFNTIFEDTRSEFDTSTGIFTAKEAGFYQVSANVLWETTSANQLYDMYIYSTSPSKVRSRSRMNSATTFTNFAHHVSGLVELNAGGTIEIRLYQNSGASETIFGDATNDWISVSIVKVA